MILSDLPSPGALTGAYVLRKETARALSYVQLQCKARNVLPDQLVTLRAFFRAAMSYLDELEEAGPAGARPLVVDHIVNQVPDPVDPDDLGGETAKA